MPTGNGEEVALPRGGGGTFVPQTCCAGVTWGRVGYPPPGLIFYPTHGGVKIVSGGWSDLTSHPGTPLPGIGAAIGVLGRIPGKSCCLTQPQKGNLDKALHISSYLNH